MFRATLLAIVLGLQAILYLKGRRWVRDRFPARRGLQVALAAIFLLFNAAMAFVLLARPKIAAFPPWFVAFAVNPFYIWHGATLILGLIVLVGLVIAFPFRILHYLLRVTPAIGPRYVAVTSRPAVQQFNASRRAFLRTGMTGLTAASFGGATYGVLAGKSDLEFTRQRFTLPNLPAAFDGFTIGMVSDVHSSAFMTKEDMDEYVRALLSLRADLIVVPGDFVNAMTEEVYPFAESFSALHAPHGVYGVMGNHDFFARDPDRVAREVDACGVRLLRNDHTMIRRGDAGIALAGVDDVGRSDRAASAMDTAVHGTPAGIPRILLCHRPYFLQEAKERNIDVVLSGHTHGGQVVFGRFGELTLTPAQIASRYIWGPYRLGSAQMFVSRGIGTVGLPMRINCPPEVALITLSRT
ncbi:MAG: metallophosphoesterase [Bacteroidota bacterium]